MKIIFLLFSMSIFFISLSDIATSRTCNDPRVVCTDLMPDGACYPDTSGSPQNSMLCNATPGALCPTGLYCCGTIPCPAPH